MAKYLKKYFLNKKIFIQALVIKLVKNFRTRWHFFIAGTVFGCDDATVTSHQSCMLYLSAFQVKTIYRHFDSMEFHYQPQPYEAASEIQSGQTNFVNGILYKSIKISP